MRLAASFALAKAGNSIPARIAMMAITTSNSMSVNAARCAVRFDSIFPFMSSHGCRAQPITLISTPGRGGKFMENCGNCPTDSVPRQLQLHVRALPGFGELTLDVIGLLSFALGAKGLFEAEEAPAVARPALDVVPENLFGPRGVAGLEEGGAEGEAGRNGPVGGFHVGDCVLGGDSFLQLLDHGGHVSFRSSDLAGQPGCGHG